MKRQIKLTQQQQEQEQHAAEQQSQQTAGREFATPEEMLRHDALHTPVPPAIGHRLQDSLAQVPPPPRAWWRRWFGS
jgi:hypothetical protein